MPRIPLIGPSGQGRAASFNARRAINLYVEVDDAGGRSRMCWIGRPGLKLFATASGVVRGNPVLFGDHIYYVAGNTLYKMDSTGTETVVATLTSNSGNYVSMTRNRTQILIVDGTQEMFVYEPDTNTFTVVDSFSTTSDVTAITFVSGTGPYTYNVAASNHGGSVGNKVKITGTTNFNGTHTITAVPDANNFRIEMSTNPADETGLTAATAYVRSDTLTIQPSHCEQMDGYFIVNNTRVSTTDGVHAGQFYISLPDDGTTWEATDYGVPQRNPDDLKRIFAYSGVLNLIGEYSIESYYDEGSGDMPFQPNRDAAGPWGCRSPWTVAQVGDGIAWVGQRSNGQVTVLLMEGYIPKEVASHAVAYALSQASSTDLDNATAFAFRAEGHDFYVLQVGSQTWVYDAAESQRAGVPLWYEWQTSGSRWSARWYVYAWGKHLVTDPANGNIYELDWGTYTDNGNGISRIGVSGYIHAEDKPVFHSRVGLIMDHAGTSGSVRLESSDDNGNTWSDHGTLTVGASYTKVEWHQLGRALQDRLYRFTWDGDYKVVVVDAYVDVVIGSN